MELLTAPSKVSQISSHLRKMIKKNNYPAGSRLSGTRELAKQYKVSAKTIKCALDILQKERLIRCEHGRGIFIESQPQGEDIEIYILLWGMRREPCNYFTEILKLAYPPILKDGFSFTLRTIFKDSDDFKHFDQELARIENSPHIKCVLTNAAQYNIEHFEKLNNLSCPVIYFGESKYEEAASYPCNRIIDTSSPSKACMSVIEELGEKEVTLFVPDGSVFFYKEFTRSLVMISSQAGIKLNLFEVPSSLFAEPDKEKVREVYSRQISKALAGGQLDCPVVIHGMINQIFLDDPNIKKRLESKTPFLEANLAADNIKLFYNATFELIKSVFDSPGDIQHKTVCNPLLVSDFCSGRQFLYENDTLKVVN